ncbi:MAG TPA: PAS domain S-box protein [Geothrix sp.]|jgi:PAS domain S-box-containing protein
MTHASQPPRITPSTFAKGIWVFLVAFNLVAAGAAAWMLRLSHRHYVDRAEITTQNLAQVLEENVEGTVRQIDQALQAIQDEAQRDPAGPRLGAVLQVQFHRVGLLQSLQLADPAGRITQGAPSLAAAPVEVAGQAFFLRLKEDPRAELVISRPVRGPSGAWGIVLARRLTRPDGGFAGAVCATLATEQLARAMSRLDVGQKGSVSLRGEDLSLLIRYPDYVGQQQMTGNNQVQGDYLAAVGLERTTVQFTTASTIDGMRRTYTLRKTGQPRFFILVGLAQDEYLQAWRHQAAFTVVAVLGMVSLTIGLGLVARTAWQRQRADQARLASEEAKYRLLAENALDIIWSMDVDGHLTYISPSVFRQRGWTAEEFMNLSPENRALSKEGAETVRERMAASRLLPPGAQPFERDMLQATVKRKDGQEILVEAQWRLVWGEDGRLLGFQGVTRDITERKRMETEREDLIRELTQALTEVKQLSGLLPICSQCKKVRDDHGYWSQIETYLSEHSKATFTHGVCPECAATFRQEMQARREQRDPDERQG